MSISDDDEALHIVLISKDVYFFILATGFVFIFHASQGALMAWIFQKIVNLLF